MDGDKIQEFYLYPIFPTASEIRIGRAEKVALPRATSSWIPFVQRPRLWLFRNHRFLT
jgi:hypothetical protein